MARAFHVKSARKDYPEHGIKKGDAYYWWKFRFSGRRFSKTAPKPSQLTESDFLSQVYAVQETLGDFEFSTVSETTKFEADADDKDVCKHCSFPETDHKDDKCPEDPDDDTRRDDIKSAIEDAVSELENLKSETEDKLSNMPESLQQGPTGELLQGRADSLQDMIDELEGIDTEQENVEDVLNDVQGVSYNGE